MVFKGLVFLGVILFSIIVVNIASEMGKRRAAAELEALTPEQVAARQHAKLQNSANGACMEFIKQSLNDPSSAEFMHSPRSMVTNKDDVWTVIRPVRAKNALGALVLENFICTMKFSNNTWTAINIQQLRL